MFSFTEKDLDAVALLKPVTANNNKINIDAAIAAAHKARSEHMYSMIDALFTGVAKLYTSYTAKQTAIAQLNAMSNSELSDLGVSRSNIKNAVMGEVAFKTPVSTRVKKLFSGLQTSFEGWQRRRVGYALLMAMDTRQLNDIGLTRSGILAAMNSEGGLANDNQFAANNNGGRKVS
ncbi:MAG: DUF1127 domain-containing protein [Sneathiella sp.]